MLSNAYFLAKFRFDTAENEPAKNLQNFRKMHFSKMHFRKMHFRKMYFRSHLTSVGPAGHRPAEQRGAVADAAAALALPPRAAADDRPHAD